MVHETFDAVVARIEPDARLVLAPLALQLSHLSGSASIRFWYTTSIPSTGEPLKHFLECKRGQAKLGTMTYQSGWLGLTGPNYLKRVEIANGVEFDAAWWEFLKSVKMRILVLDTARAQRAAARCRNQDRLDRFRWAQKCRDTRPTDRA